MLSPFDEGSDLVSGEVEHLGRQAGEDANPEELAHGEIGID